MNRRISFLAATIALCFAACGYEYPLWSDIDLDDYERIPELEALDLTQVTPANPVDYWELRHVHGSDFERVTAPTQKDCPKGTFSTSTTDQVVCDVDVERFEVVGGVGTLCEKADEPKNCVANFNKLGSDGGFGHYYCFDDCYYYYALADGEEHRAQSSTLDFLGTIDSEEEAILVAFAAGYGWDPGSKKNGAVRRTGSSFELILTRTSNCPQKTTRYLVRISSNGDIKVLRSQTAKKEDSCVVV